MLAPLIATAVPSSLVAFSARFYYPPGDNRTSYHQIYTSDLHGKRRRQLTFSQTEKTDVRWVGRTKLAWVESTAVAKEETGIGTHASGKDRLVEYDLRSGKQRVLSTGFLTAAKGDRQQLCYPRGQAVYLLSKSNDIATDDPTDPGVVQVFAVTKGALRPVRVAPTSQFPRREADDSDDSYNPEPWLSAGLKVKASESTKEARLPIRGGAGAYTAGPSTDIQYHGKRMTIPVPDIDLVWPSARNPMICWVRHSSFASSAGSDLWLDEVNLGTGKTRLIAEDVLDLDFQADQRYWSSSSSEKMVTMVGKKRVWQRELWVGDERTGKQWRIASGAVHGDSARIQP